MAQQLDGKIYKIVNILDENLFYVGGTIESLIERFGKHKYGSERYETRFFYQEAKKLGWNNFRIELIEEFPCDSREELRKEEDRFIRELRPYYNIRRAFLTEEERKEYKERYYQDNKEKVIAQYRQNNKEHIAQQHARYYQDNKEKIKQRMEQYNQDNKEHIAQQKAQYRQDHIEQVSQWEAKYRQDHKEQIAQKGARWYRDKICKKVLYGIISKIEIDLS